MPEDELFRITLPPGRHRLPRDFVARHQRDRLFAAMIKLADEQGYPATSLTQIVKTAGIARHTFYEHFEDKESLFLALFDNTADLAIRTTAEAVDAETAPWEAKIRAGVAALLAMIAREPALTRVCMIESQSAGVTALARREDAMRRFASMLRTGRDVAPRGAELPEALEDILVGGIVWMVNKRLAVDDGDVEALLPEILEFVIAPYLGNAAAHQAAQLRGRLENPPPGGG